MQSKSLSALPRPVKRALADLGRDIAIARKRRRLSAASLAERVFTTRPTIARIEKGDPGVSIGTVLTTLHMLGLLDRLADIADPEADTVGMNLELERLPKRVYPVKD